MHAVLARVVDEEVQAARSLVEVMLHGDSIGRPSYPSGCTISISRAEHRPQMRGFVVEVELCRSAPCLKQCLGSATTSSSAAPHGSAITCAAAGSNDTFLMHSSTCRSSCHQSTVTATVEALFPYCYPADHCVWRSLVKEPSASTVERGCTPFGAYEMGNSGAAWPPLSCECVASHECDDDPLRCTKQPIRERVQWKDCSGGGPFVFEEFNPQPLEGSGAEGCRRDADVGAVHTILQPILMNECLSWMSRGRQTSEMPFLLRQSPPPHEGPFGGEGQGLRTVPSFLRDLVLLTRCWAALEIDMHSLVVPPHVMRPDLNGCSPPYVKTSFCSVGVGLPPASAIRGVSGGGMYRVVGRGSSMIIPPVGTAAAAAALSQQMHTTGGNFVSSRERLGVPVVVNRPGTSHASVKCAEEGGARVFWPGSFSAVLLPYGGVAMWGCPVNRSSYGPQGKSKLRSPMKTQCVAEGHLFLASPMRDETVMAFRGDARSKGSGHTTVLVQQGVQSQIDGVHLNVTDSPLMTSAACDPGAMGADLRKGDVVALGTRVFFTNRLHSSLLLPTIVTPSQVLLTNRQCLWSDICLYLPNAHAALQANAKLCKSLRLYDVAQIFHTLRRLVRNLGGVTVEAYIKGVLSPVLHECITVLQTSHQPFWAGVVVCCLVLPSVLNDIPCAPVAPFLGGSSRCISAVALLERIFTIAGANSQRGEARLARQQLEKSWHSSNPPPAIRVTPPPRKAPKDALSHTPITTCAVCGLSLLRDDRCPLQQSALPHAPTESCPPHGSQALQHPTRTPIAEGCLVIQCVRCGHGGHVEHITRWWEDSNVKCCPKGCDCVCIY